MFSAHWTFDHTAYLLNAENMHDPSMIRIIHEVRYIRGLESGRGHSNPRMERTECINRINAVSNGVTNAFHRSIIVRERRG